MLLLRAAPLPSAPSQYRCVGCTAASARPGMARFATVSCPRLVRFVHRRQRRVAGFLLPSASAPTDSGFGAQSNTLLLKQRSLALSPGRVQAVLWFYPSSGLTLPSSGPAFGGPLKSHVRRHTNTCLQLTPLLLFPCRSRCLDRPTRCRARRATLSAQ